jgi:TonB family protein
VSVVRVDIIEDERRGRPVLALLLLASAALHVAFFAATGAARGPGRRARRRPPTEVTMQVTPPRAPPAPAVAPRAPAARPVVRRVVARVVAPAATPPRPAAPVEAPADFSGVTLTNDGAGPGWSSAVGDGAAMRGPIGAPGARAAPAPAAAPPGPPLVALASLSRPPAPPDLGDVLERHYPEPARRQGLAGEAVLRARITPDGRARDLVVVSQSLAGFGDACRATLRDSVWSAPLDREGRAVATLVTYTCRFEVR